MVDTETLTLDAARDLIAAALVGAGTPRAAAVSVAAALVQAEAEGQVGHGFSRLEDYAAQVRSGKIVADAAPEVTRAAPAYLTIDAGHGFAFPALDIAAAQAIEVAAEMGTVSVAVTRSHHCGALSVQVDRLARAGLVALMVANTPAAISPWGGHSPVFGTNPIAFAAPRTGGADPLVIDLSLSRVARGKVMAAHKAGQPIPDDWALDAEGQPTTDPEAALAGSMLPIGGPKGTSLALLVEVLAAVLPAAALSAQASSFFAADGPPPGVGQFILALRPPGDVEDFAARLEPLLHLIEAQKGARLPGQRRLAALARARRDGLNVPTRFTAIARALSAP